MLKTITNNFSYKRLLVYVFAIVCALVLFSTTPGYANYATKAMKTSIQPLLVRGKVRMENGQPLVGATVRVKGSQRATLTDRNGDFTIQVPDRQTTLVFSYVGFTTKEQTLENGVNLQVVLQRGGESLDDVLVVVPYGTETRGSFTGSATTITGADLADRPRSSFQNSLQGNVAGLQSMESTGQPGAAPTLRIRGITSFNGISSPLYVIDGVPMLTQDVSGLALSSNSGAGINPNDIESITVLKDASATSIYGSEGANGVIMITTKSGKAGKTKINLSVNYGLNDMATSQRNKPLSTAEMSKLLIEGVINSDINPSIAGISTPEAAYQYLVDQGLDPEVNTNWFDVITQLGKYEQYNVSASGGNDKTSFYLSGGYYKQDAVTKGQGFERKTGRVNLKHKASDRLSFDGKLSIVGQKLNTVPAAGTGQNPVRSLYRLVPWLAPYDENGLYNTRITYNPELLLNENKYETNIMQVIGSAGIQFKILDHLSFETRGGVDIHYTDDFRFWSKDWPDGGATARGMEYNRLWNNWTITNLLKYKEQLSDFGLTATLGQEARKRNLKSVSTQANNYAAEDLYTLANTSEPYIAWSSKSHATIASYFLNTSVNYKTKYYLNATVRRDGSSRFGKNVRYGNFWSLGVAWNIHDEAFVDQLGFVNQLKLRASYGTSGNQLGSYYGHIGAYGTNRSYLNQPGVGIASIESGSLRWEKNLPMDVGLDFSLFSNRLSGTFDWYSRITSDLIQLMPVSHVNGITNLNYNVGKMKNYGLEIVLNSDNIVPENPDGFAWSTSFNITTQNNKILAYQDDRVVSGYYLREVGDDYYKFYLRGYAGVDIETGQSLWYTNGTKEATTTDYTKAAPYDQKKSALASFFGGLTNTFSYKGVSLSALIYFNWGGYIYDRWGVYTHSDGSARLSEAGLMNRMLYENRWQQPGDHAIYPKIVYGGNQSGLTSQHSTRFLYDGSYIRLRDITLSYALPIERSRTFTAASVFVRANNLFTYIHDDLLPYDPEVGISGVLDQNLPISKQYVLGINLSF